MFLFSFVESKENMGYQQRIRKFPVTLVLWEFMPELYVGEYLWESRG